jgi:hypothetical protein
LLKKADRSSAMAELAQQRRQISFPYDRYSLQIFSNVSLPEASTTRMKKTATVTTMMMMMMTTKEKKKQEESVYRNGGQERGGRRELAARRSAEASIRRNGDGSELEDRKPWRRGEGRRLNSLPCARSVRGERSDQGPVLAQR